MTRERARAYARVMAAIRDLGPAKLLASEQARIRSTADALLFSSDVLVDRDARAAFSDFETLCERLVESGRWNPARTAELASDVWACSPAIVPALPAAA